MTPHGPPLTLTFPSDLRFLGIARAFVEAVCKTGGLSRAATDAVVLATNEATSNVIRHAHQDQPGAQVQIVCRLCAEGIEVCLHDEGQPFNLDAVPHLNPAEIRLGGRGVFLMRRLMDELTCEAQGERGNVLRMVKRCRCDRSASAG
jgi:serine/threonine-protein kinase RsbW